MFLPSSVLKFEDEDINTELVLVFPPENFSAANNAKRITEGALADIEIDRMYSTVCFNNLLRSPRSQITVFQQVS